MMRKYFITMISIWICIIVEIAGNYFQAEALYEWYPLLYKSPLTPPRLAFHIIWTINYILMGWAEAILFLSNSKHRISLSFLFALQLLCVFTWNIMFYYFQNPLYGFITILVLDLLVITYMLRVYSEKKICTALMIPYLLWILFTSYLNGFIVFNN